MQTHSNTEGASILEELIEACRPCIERMARKYAHEWYRVDYDDFVSIGVLEVCKEAKSAMTKYDAVPYLCKCAQHRMIDELKRMRKQDVLSLDALQFDDSSKNLADLLVDPGSSDHESERACVVQQSMQHLTDCERLVLSCVYGFSGTGYVSYRGAAKEMGIPKGTVSSVSTRARRKLRQDALLCKVVGVEVGA
jgi:RNA polymerase sigma factor (sigma-70 family)